MFRASRLLLPASALAAFLAGCPAKEQHAPAAPDAGGQTATSTSAAIEVPPGDGPVATVNGTPVPREPFNKEYVATITRYQRARHDVQPSLRERLKDNIVRRLVDAELIRQQAEKLGVVVTPEEREEQWQTHKKRYGTEESFKEFLARAGTTEADVRAQLESNNLREKVFAKVSENISVAPEEVKDFYEKNAARYEEKEQVQASHILIRLSPNPTPEEKKQKRARAEEALKKAKAKGADFAAVAREYGEDPTKDRGGDLGYFAKGRMVKPFEDAVWPMKKGQISGIIETQFGYHIVKKVDQKPERKKPFKEVEEQIQKSLLAKKKNEAIRDALQKWKTDAKIEIFVKGDEKIMATSPAGIPGMPQATGAPPGAMSPNTPQGVRLQKVEAAPTPATPVSHD